MNNHEHKSGHAPMHDPSREKTQALKTTYRITLSTHPGKQREHNEDNFIVNNVYRKRSEQQRNLRGGDIGEPTVCAVFDGMGGEAYGDLASELCAKNSVALYRDLKDPAADIDALVDRFATAANNAVVDKISSMKTGRSGSTFVMVVLHDGMVYPYSLGDSRLYLYRAHTLTQITSDHTLAMKKYLANIYTLEEANASPDSHKLTAFLGVDIDKAGVSAARYEPFIPARGDRLLLCSDGLYDMCSDDEIAAILEKNTERVSLDLVEAALDHGGVDNVTCIVIERE